jgi:large subunit ribosomal protein L7/L12
MTTITSIEERIKGIEGKAAREIEQLKAKQEKIEQKKLNALMKTDRARETRRKILAGSLIIKIMENDEAAKTRFMNQLDKYLTRTDDRALFNLKLLPEKTATPKVSDNENKKVSDKVSDDENQ